MLENENGKMFEWQQKAILEKERQKKAHENRRKMTEEPDFVNEEGTKWWVDKIATQYATKKDSFGVQLPGVVCFRTELSDGYSSFVVVDGQKIVFTSQQTDAIGCHIDVMKMAKRYGQVQSVVICDSCCSEFNRILDESIEASKKRINELKGAGNHFEARFWEGSRSALQVIQSYFYR